ncbi:MAG: hypothetical protein H7Y88_03640 [Phycisphaerales bacterium]|nr:hypothetical protein [Phycisphaerales bacterium]
MKPSLVLLWSATIIGASTSLLFTAPSMFRARVTANTELTKLHGATDAVRQILAARAAMPSLPADGADSSALATRLSTVLSSCGIPASSLSSLTPDTTAQAAPGTVAVRRRAGLTLTGITLPQIGRFLDAWRTAEPAWVAASIDVTPEHQRTPPAPGGPGGGDLPLRAVISLERLVFQGEAR